LADPVRESILLFLGEQALSVTHLAQRFEISRPAISRHLRVLRESGLVSESKAGRQRIYSLDRAMLAEVAGWLEALATDQGEAEGGNAPEPPTSNGRAEVGWRQW